MKVLDKVCYPSDLKGLELEDLKLLIKELREELILHVSKTGGHLGASLGVAELTIALHYVFDTPTDRIIWDTGHQSHIHKMVTGRRDKIPSMRKKGGISCFTSIKESEYDVFGTGHSSTSISVASAIAKARDMEGDKYFVIPVIGDGALSAGMAFEGLNNLVLLDMTRVLIIVNDNGMSISKSVGGITRYLDLLASGCTKANFFEDIGYKYIGVVDGHDLESLISVLVSVRDCELDKPVVLHVRTKKGYSLYLNGGMSKDAFHAVQKFDYDKKLFNKSTVSGKTYTSFFVDALQEIMLLDKKVVAITAAMSIGTGLDSLPNQSRVFDVGIAEQHAVTFAAGFASVGYLPICAIYSTFLQRGFDQMIHDVAIQNLPVIFCVDRAGFVGGDGATHNGCFDLMFTVNIPNMTVMVPVNGIELSKMLFFAYRERRGPVVIRYPKGIPDVILDNVLDIEYGTGTLEKDLGDNVVFLVLGPMLKIALEASDILYSEHGIASKVFNARFAKPIDHENILRFVRSASMIVTIEDGGRGAFSSAVLELLSQHNLLSKNFYSMVYPDSFVEHDSVENIKNEIGFTTEYIVHHVVNNLFR
ncbi:MAG: 1-deoxy-D-xylulose-5-phosphate synthase [Candidatus Xenolissoclinum pacificiensis L6]|uniref:1-deoxy-D-xylulose-5-phosphate synthase n=1 Tax=Candidatus Xenolissoclinum pacificiensis L6 TaxID=1401685 RepID=W2V1A4_9RICK|nr:MAG: 1-deoxy-D-xylulose-5-phosphate synthase [Candidatus Xenolissoclinum pacificiensis L6]